MKIIPTQKLKDFILSQPDDRRINMQENNSSVTHSCGCVLVQFQKKNRLPKGIVGFSTLGRKHAFSDEVIEFISECLEKQITTYKQAKELLHLLP